MNNRLIKVNKKNSDKLIKNDFLQISKYTNNSNSKIKRYKSINKLNQTQKRENIFSKKLSVDLYINRKNKNNDDKHNENKKKDIKNKNNDKKAFRNNIIKKNSMDKIKFKKNNNIKILNYKKENNIKANNRQNDKNIFKLEINNINNYKKNNFQINSKKNKRTKTLNKNSNNYYLKKELKEIEYQANKMKSTNEVISKELDIISTNRDIIGQNEIKIKQIINDFKKDNHYKNKFFEEYINKEKIQNKNHYNFILLNENNINKLKEIKENIEKYMSKIYDFIFLSKNVNFIINDNIHSILETKKYLFNLKENVPKFFQLSKEIQNNQKIIDNNLKYEIIYLKNLVQYIIKEKGELIKNYNLKPLSLNLFEKKEKSDLNLEKNKENKDGNQYNNKNNIKTSIKNEMKIDNNIIHVNTIGINKNSNKKLENYNNLREKLLMNLEKENLKKIVLLAPKKDNSNLSDLINYLKNNTITLNIIDKAYIVFYWMAENIIYDKKALKSEKNIDSSPEGIYKYGKTACFGYSKLFAHIANSIGVDTEYIIGYAKGYEYIPGEKIEKTNHEWNAIKFNDNYFLLDSTWGSGQVEEDSHIKELDDFYFLCNPQYLIFTHFPKEEKWQLLEKPITKEDFFNQVQIQSCFFKYHFTDINFKQSHFEVKNLETLKIWYETKHSDDIIDISIDIFKLEDNSEINENNCDYIIKNEKDFEIKLIFNKKGNYKICLYAKNQYMDEYEAMIEYYPFCKQDSINELHFPEIYSNASDIQIIQPLYDNLKIGEEVKFIIRSKVLDKLIILGERWYYLNKIKEEYFEENVKIGKKCAIGKKYENGKFIYLVKYNLENTIN